MRSKRVSLTALAEAAALAAALVVLVSTAWSAPSAPSESDAAAGWADPTPAATTVCGNGLVELGESCEACPADCAVRGCTPTEESKAIRVKIIAAPATSPAAVAVRLAYRSERLRLPGSGLAPEVGARVKSLAPATQVIPNDMEHSLRVVLTNAQGLGGAEFEVRFDRCAGAAPSTDDVACWIERCSGGGGAISGCSCTIEEVK